MPITLNTTKLVCFTAVAILFASCALKAEKVQCSSNKPESSQPLAFPGAEGGGRYTTGGRGGKVIKVTNLNDRGPGSLREAIRTPGPRTIVFEVSGTINLESPLRIVHGDLTVAGQTAPGHGICIKGHETRLLGNNIIIRFIRFRLGDEAGREYDAITGMHLQNIIIDHCSFSWSTDETVTFYDNENFTLQWSIISESLNNSIHRKGAHGYGGIWGGYNATFAYNILAHHYSRNPRLQGIRNSSAKGKEKAELVNNLIYNWGDRAIYGGENGSYNIIDNIFIPGPATKSSSRREILEPYEPYGQFFLEGNVLLGASQKTVLAGVEKVAVSEVKKNSIISTKPISTRTEAFRYEVNDAYNWVLRFAGASFFRDEIDQRIIADITNRSYTFGSKGLIDSQDQTPGWPFLVSEVPAFDGDGDGIPDEWETSNGLDPLYAKDGNEYTLDPNYTNLEVYLNQLVKHTFPEIL